jgi:heme/copper-type cytochrome/quinol oxidase subunit 3
VYEFTEFLHHGLGFTTNVASSSFYALTGLHGVHVAVGVIMLLATVGMSFRRRIQPEAVEVVGLYWHFVDIVWVLIFTIIYLIP